MTAAEVWLRLMGVKGLCGDKMLQAARTLIHGAHSDPQGGAAAGLDSAQIQAFQTIPHERIEQALRWLELPGHYLVTADDPLYPPQLRDIARYPAAIMVYGDPHLLSTSQLAVIGSRNASHYGRQWGDYFAQHLALSGLTITSGLARGIDAVAHRGALAVKGKTIAVLGSGLSQLYPTNHKRLAEEIVAAGGALVSEFPLYTLPYPHNFPRRNRIISGLSLGVLVVEASLRSGSLVTALYALEQNRDVYALPGPLGSPDSEGGHWLIQQGALLVAHPNNILEQLNSSLYWLPLSAQNGINSSDNADAPLPFADVLANVGDEVTPVDVVAERAGQPVPAIIAKLLELELAGWIAAVPGGYVRLRRAGHVRRTNVLV